MHFLVYVVCGFAIFLQTDCRSVNNDDPEQVVFSAEEHCVRRLNVDRSKMMEASMNHYTPEDNEDYGKFFVCTWRKRGVLQEDGTIDEEKFASFIKQMLKAHHEENLTVADEIVERCKDTKESTEGRTGIKLKNCVMQILIAQEMARRAQSSD